VQAFDEAEAAEKAVTDLLKGLTVAPPEPVDPAGFEVQIGEARQKLERAPKNAVTLQDLDIRLTEWQGKSDELMRQSRGLSARLSQIQTANKSLLELADKWKTTHAAYKDAGYSGAPLERIAAVLSRVDAGRSELDKMTKPLLEAQANLSRARAMIEEHLDFLRQRKKDLTASRWAKDRLSVFEMGAFRFESQEEEAGFWSQLKQYGTESDQYLQAVVGRVVLSLLALTLIWLGLRQGLLRLHRRAEEVAGIEELRALFRNAFSIALLLVSLPQPFLHPNAPLPVRDLYLLILIFPLTIILLKLMTEREYRRLILGLAGCYILGIMHQLTFSLPPLDRILIMIQAAFGLALCLLTIPALQARPPEGEGKTQRYKLAGLVVILVMSALFVLTITTQLLGYNRASVFFGQGAFNTIYITFFILAVYRLLRSLLVYLSHIQPRRPLRVLQQYRHPLLDKTSRGLSLAAALTWLYMVLSVWEVRPAAAAPRAQVVCWGGGLGETPRTLGLALAGILALWASVWISRLLILVLEEEIYPRSKLDPGLQNAISQVTRYALVLLGFVIALAILGVRLQSLAIIAGALGVGIGFGLQNIVNNFVSGLIILVERPIKVGDVLEMDGVWAKVKHIGIRATMIETFDQSEIIVPNGDLLGSKIVNWTHFSGVNRISIQVGVAYGSNPAAVLDILRQAAYDHPQVLKDPIPFAYFKGFGESSLDFELYCFLPSTTLRLSVGSELRVAIYQALQRAGIEIPFPQREIWIKGTKKEEE
jgi:small-conductance mechanosensitive channel